MKKLLFFLSFITLSFIANARIFYVSTTGNDSRTPTQAQNIATPWLTLNHAAASGLVAGDTVLFRGGTYLSTAGNAAAVHFQIESLTGTLANPIVFMAYPGEVPVFSCENITPTENFPIAMWVYQCNYVKVYGFKVKMLREIATGAGVSQGFQFAFSDNCTLENCDIYNIGGAGLVLNNSDNNLIKNVDSHNLGAALMTPAWDYGDAFSSTGGDNSNNNTFDGCRAWMCGDDGWDFFEWAGSKVTIINCWSFWNSIKPWGISGTQPSDAGMTPTANPSLFLNNSSYWTSSSSGEGFKLGGCNSSCYPSNCGCPAAAPTVIKKYLSNCLSFENQGTGYSANMESQFSHKMQFYNCVAYSNGNDGWGFGTGRSTNIAMGFKNCWSFSNNRVEINGADFVYDGLNSSNITNNLWMTVSGNDYGNLYASGKRVSTADFQSVSSAQMVGTRNADGSLPTVTYLKLVAGSDLIDAGIQTTNPVISFCGTAPDVNWAEYCAGVTSPVANAGVDQTITLPVSNVTLSGTATTSGSITNWNWQKISGGNALIGTPNAQTTGASGLVQGVYLFMLTVTDNAGLTDTDTMQVTVNAAAATAPTCSAGTTPVTITLPVSSVALTGTGASTAGNTVSYLWSLIVGSGGSITNPIIASTTATGLTAGSRTYRLTVTDNGNSLTCTSDKVVITNAALVIPTANAGANQSITLPTNSVSLSGSGSGGTINSYLWTKISGVGGSFSASTSASTNFTGLVAGTYQVQLRVGNTDGNFGYDTVQITVNPAPAFPSCNAGVSPVTITLPISTVALAGTGGSNSGNTVSFLWTQFSGTSVTINNATSSTATAIGLTAGSYGFQLTVTDNGNGLICSSTKMVNVNAANVIPTANAGANQTITLPTNSVALSGSGSGGTINSYLWTKISGVNGTLSAATSANTNFTGLSAGVYLVQLRVGNTDGNFGYDTVQITVNPAIVLPTANAGANDTITLPLNFVALNGVGTGTQVPLTYLWTKLSGTGGTITSSTSAVTSVTGLVAGVYSFEFKVTDNNGNIARDTMGVTVLEQAFPPTVNAGADQSITLPTTTATVTATYSLSQSTVSSLTWTQTSGAAATITSPSTASTTITGLAAGTYVFTFTVVTADGWTVSDALTITVIDVTSISGFKWFNASLINGKSNLTWGFNGGVSGQRFTIQKVRSWFFLPSNWWTWSNIGSVAAVTGITDYWFIDNNTNKGSNIYRVKYGNMYSPTVTVKKN